MTLPLPDIRRATPFFVLFLLAIAVRPSAAATSCSSPPLFDLSGATCSTTKQGVPCGCSECVIWDASAGATWYEIQRCDAVTGACTIVGDTKWKNRSGVTTRMWCAAWDAPFPIVGVSYDYRVRACRDGASGALCSTTLSNSVRYVGAPYMCFQGGLEVACAATMPPPSSGVTDLDGDGSADAVDVDDDDDGRNDLVDNCPRDANFGQRDADRDGIGDLCDNSPWTASVSPSGADADGDGIPDIRDVCA